MDLFKKVDDQSDIDINDLDINIEDGETGENLDFKKEREGGDKTKESHPKKFFLGLGVGLLAIIFLMIIILGFGIYYFKWEGRLISGVVKVIPYPIAFVNNQPIRFSEYQDDMATLQNFIKLQGGEEASGLERKVLDRLIQNEVANQLARKYNIKIAESDLDAEIQKIIEQEGTKEKVEEILKQQYDWGIEKFKDKVLRPFLLQEKLQAAIIGDEELNKKEKERAEEVLRKVKSGEKSFEELAKEYGEDGTASEGGDLGFFGRGEMVKEFEDAAFSLGKGEVSGLVLTKYGYHIIKVEDIKKDDNGETEKVQARHILVRVRSFDEILEEKIKESKIWELIKF